MGINLDVNSNQRQQGLARKLIIGILVVIGAWAFYLISSDQKTPREANLLALILTSVSIGASWLASKIYAEVSASQSLRDYGVQIARGVIVLQSEIKLLSSWVARKRASCSEGPTPESLDSAFDHVQETLTTFRFQTDAALSGIAGVIGDALSQYDSVMDEIRKTREKAASEADQIERHMRGATDSRPRAEPSAQPSAPSPAAFQSTTNELSVKLDELAKQTEEKIAALSRRSSLPIFEESPNRRYEVACPACGKIDSGEIPDRAGETKAIRCAQCNSRFNIHSASGRQLHVRLISVGIINSSTTPSIQPLPSPICSTDNKPSDPVQAGIFDWPFLLPPNQLRILIASCLRLQSDSVNSGSKLSQVSLREKLFVDQEVSATGISRRKIRGFVQALFFGRLFLYHPGEPISADTPIENVFSEEQIVSAYVRSCAHHVGKHVAMDVAPIHLVNLIFPASESADATLRLAVDAALDGLASGTRKRIESQQSGGGGCVPTPLRGAVKESVDTTSIRHENVDASNS